MIYLKKINSIFLDQLIYDKFFYSQRIAEALRTASQIQVPRDFKDLVQKRCEDRGILFMPLPNRYREGKPIYKVGNVQVYIESDTIYVCRGSNWFPTDLNTLLDTAEIS